LVRAAALEIRSRREKALEYYGEAEIRTLDTLLGYNALKKDRGV
jgi:hypothetical protein